jgi:uncharacterized protein (TIGR02118 family)
LRCRIVGASHRPAPILRDRGRAVKSASERAADEGAAHGMIKRVSLLTRRTGMTREQFTRHWLEVHAPLAHAVPGLRRYVQSHVVEEYRRPDIPTSAIEVDGIAELWFESRVAMERALASPEMAALHADGALFIGSNKTFVVEEKVIISGPVAQP